MCVAHVCQQYTHLVVEELQYRALPPDCFHNILILDEELLPVLTGVDYMYHQTLICSYCKIIISQREMEIPPRGMYYILHA